MMRLVSKRFKLVINKKSYFMPNMKVGPNTTLLAMVRRALALGYSTIALNTEVG